ncbi:serine-rich adhesin for platelets-like isoform X1 [Leptotrombidium deliense]|uniref:Serine-rich adhesin for platelets-like isoform X1 n=1 Tax=Leptotrombidium deliense TaxID=299467 RepID=A0A443SS31_9ACAR|nr:serine-rich adhesin for platelets-like isoform X1 [Leptotrombidium deliense]
MEYAKCPYSLGVTLSSTVSRTLADSYNLPTESVVNGGTKNDVAGEELYRESIKKLNELCDTYKEDTEEAIKLSAKYCAKPFLVSVCAIKNGRRKMEDRHVILHDLNSLFGIKSNKQYSYYGVFDGHAGIHAATYAASHLHSNLIKSQAFKDGEIKDAIKRAFSETDLYYLERSAREGIRSGSTAVCCLFEGHSKLYLAWLGDSQAVLVKKGKPYDIMNPHKPERDDERHRIEEMGGMVSCIDTWRVNGTLAVSRAIGDPEHKPYVSSDPDVEEITLDGDEDFIVMACDGLWDQITPEEATTIVYQHLAENSESTCLNDIAENVSEILTENAKKEGSTDNITVIVLFLRDIQSILSTPFAPPSPKERSLVNNLLDFNDNSNLGNPFANGSDINCNSSELEKNLLNSTNHIEAPTPPVDSLMSANNLNLNCGTFDFNTLQADEQKPQLNPFSDWENASKLYEKEEKCDSFVSPVSAEKANEEIEAELLDNNSNNTFNIESSEQAELVDFAVSNSEINDVKTSSMQPDHEIPDLMNTVKDDLLKNESSKILNSSPYPPTSDEPDFCSQIDSQNLFSPIMEPVQMNMKESSETCFDTFASSETIESKEVDLPETNDVKHDNEFFTSNQKDENFVDEAKQSETSLPQDVYFSSNYDSVQESKQFENLLPEESTSTTIPCADDTLYLSAVDIDNQGKFSQKESIEIIPQVTENEFVAECGLEPEILEASNKHELVDDSKPETSLLDISNKNESVVEPILESSLVDTSTNDESIKEEEANSVPIDDVSDEDTEKDLEWKFMKVTEPVVSTSSETPEAVSNTDGKLDKKAVIKVSSPLKQTTSTKPVSTLKPKTVTQATKTTTATKLAAGTTVNKKPTPIPGKVATRTTATRTTTSATTKVSTSSTLSKSAVSKVTTTSTTSRSSTLSGVKTTQKTATTSTTLAKQNALKTSSLSASTEKNSVTKTNTVVKNVPLSKPNTAATSGLVPKSATSKTSSLPSKPALESRVLKKSPVAAVSSRVNSLPVTKPASAPAAKRPPTATLTSKSRLSAGKVTATATTATKPNTSGAVSKLNTGRVAPKATANAKSVPKSASASKATPKVVESKTATSNEVQKNGSAVASEEQNV